MRTKAQLVRYLFLGTPGVLAYDNGRVVFTTVENERLLDVPLDDISHFRPSWVGYGCLLVLRAAGKKYSFRMTDMAAEGPMEFHSDLVVQGIKQASKEFSAMAKARQLVKTWCQFLKEVKNA